MRDRWNTSRLEAFSDGVFAIAITLLVLEIDVPESAYEDLWQGIVDQWPSYFAFITSFVTIGGIWLGHHSVFRRLNQADGVITRLNLLLLLLISFLPFPTKLVAESFDQSSSERVAVIFYGFILLLISIVTAVTWRHIGRHRDLLDPAVTDAEVAAITNQTTPNIGFYAAIVVLALLAPRVAAVGYLVIAVVMVLRSRGDSSRGPLSPGTGRRTGARV